MTDKPARVWWIDADGNIHDEQADAEISTPDFLDEIWAVVSKDDYDELKAEVERLKNEFEQEFDRRDSLKYAVTSKQVDTLTKRLERMRKLAMEFAEGIHYEYCYSHELSDCPTVKKVEALKEGAE